MDGALFVGCPDALSPQPAGCPSPGQGAVIFTIGLGDLVVDNPGCNPTAYPGGCEVDQGEKLLRHVAGVGDDGDPDTPPAFEPCFGVTTGENCGNYYFARSELTFWRSLRRSQPASLPVLRIKRIVSHDNFVSQPFLPQSS